MNKINKLKLWLSKIDMTSPHFDFEMKMYAKELVERATPKKMLRLSYGSKTIVCNCGYYIKSKVYNFCPNCGQSLGVQPFDEENV